MCSVCTNAQHNTTFTDNFKAYTDSTIERIDNVRVRARARVKAHYKYKCKLHKHMMKIARRIDFISCKLDFSWFELNFCPFDVNQRANTHQNQLSYSGLFFFHSSYKDFHVSICMKFHSKRGTRRETHTHNEKHQQPFRNVLDSLFFNHVLLFA